MRLHFQGADEGADAAEYVKRMRQQNKLIMGIGHRIKSLSNPDMRVTIIKEYALKHFKNNKVLDFAMAVEQVGRVDNKYRSMPAFVGSYVYHLEDYMPLVFFWESVRRELNAGSHLIYIPTGDHQEEGNAHPQRRRMHRCMLRGPPSLLRRIHPGRGEICSGSSQVTAGLPDGKVALAP